MVAHGAAADAAGTLVVVDVCLNHSPLTEGDYFVIANARQGASALEAGARQFLDAADLRTRTTLIPFVCGALHDAANAPKRVADENGVVDQVLTSLMIIAKPADIPSGLTIDISGLEIGNAMRVGDIALPAGVTTSVDPEEAVVTASHQTSDAVAAGDAGEAAEAGDAGEAGDEAEGSEASGDDADSSGDTEGGASEGGDEG